MDVGSSNLVYCFSISPFSFYVSPTRDLIFGLSTNHSNGNQSCQFSDRNVSVVIVFVWIMSTFTSSFYPQASLPLNIGKST